MTAFLQPSDLIDLTPADPETVRQIRWQIDRQLQHKNEQDRARKAAADANTHARRRTDTDGAL